MKVLRRPLVSIAGERGALVLEALRTTKGRERLENPRTLRCDSRSRGGRCWRLKFCWRLDFFGKSKAKTFYKQNKRRENKIQQGRCIKTAPVIVPIGPQHPALHEPELFQIFVEGETVVDVKPRIGYVHRGIEKALENRTYIQGIFLVERVCGICSNAQLP